MPEVTLHLGDCLEYMKSMPDKSVDAVITDPPYFLPAQHYQTRKVFRKTFSDLGILEHFFKDFFEEMVRVLNPDGAYYTFCDGQSYPLFWYYGFVTSKSVRPLIWDKGNFINGYHWRHQHEMILFGEMPESRPLPTGDGDVLRCKPVPVDEREHPAEKPVELLAKLATKCGHTIFDPFMGSGTTGVACMQLGRNFIGCEIEPKYFEIADRRISEARRQMILPLEGRP